MRELQSWFNNRVVQSESERTAVITRIARIPEFHSVATKAAEFAGGNSLCTSAVSQSSCACLRVKSSRVLYRELVCRICHHNNTKIWWIQCSQPEWAKMVDLYQAVCAPHCTFKRLSKNDRTKNIMEDYERCRTSKIVQEFSTVQACRRRGCSGCWIPVAACVNWRRKKMQRGTKGNLSMQRRVSLVHAMMIDIAHMFKQNIHQNNT